MKNTRRNLLISTAVLTGMIASNVIVANADSSNTGLEQTSPNAKVESTPEPQSTEVPLLEKTPVNKSVALSQINAVPNRILVLHLSKLREHLTKIPQAQKFLIQLLLR
jgi:hypothetical protein